MEKQPIDLEEFIKGTSRKYKKNQASNQNKYRDRNLRQLQFEEKRRQEEGNMRKQEESDEEDYEEMKREHEMMMGERREENMRELEEEYRAKLQEDEEYMRKLQEDEEYRRNPEKYDDMDDDDMDDDEWDEEYNKMLDEAGTYAWSTPPIDWVLDGNNSNSNKMDQPSTSSNSQASKQTQRTQLYPNVDPNLPFLRQRQLAHLQVVEEERRRQEEENNNNNPASNQTPEVPFWRQRLDRGVEEARRRQEEENNNNNQASNQVKKHPWGSTFPTEEERREDRRRQEEEERRFVGGAIEDPYRSWFGRQPSVNTSMARRDVHNNQMERGGRGNDEWTTDDDDDRRQRTRYNPMSAMERVIREIRVATSRSDIPAEDVSLIRSALESIRSERGSFSGLKAKDIAKVVLERIPSLFSEVQDHDSGTVAKSEENSIVAQSDNNNNLVQPHEPGKNDQTRPETRPLPSPAQQMQQPSPSQQVRQPSPAQQMQQPSPAQNYATMCGIDVNEVEQHWERVEQMMREELFKLQHYLEIFQKERRELEPLYDRALQNVARYHETFIIFEHIWMKNLAVVYDHEGCYSASLQDKRQYDESVKKCERAKNTLKKEKKKLDQWDQIWTDLYWCLRMADGKIKALEKALRNREGWFLLHDEYPDLAKDLVDNWYEYM